jgi:hypothetical protein
MMTRFVREAQIVAHFMQVVRDVQRTRDAGAATPYDAPAMPAASIRARIRSRRALISARSRS